MLLSTKQGNIWYHCFNVFNVSPAHGANALLKSHRCDVYVTPSTNECSLSRFWSLSLDAHSFEVKSILISVLVVRFWK